MRKLVVTALLCSMHAFYALAAEVRMFQREQSYRLESGPFVARSDAESAPGSLGLDLKFDLALSLPLVSPLVSPYQLELGVQKVADFANAQDLIVWLLPPDGSTASAQRLAQLIAGPSPKRISLDYVLQDRALVGWRLAVEDLSRSDDFRMQDILTLKDRSDAFVVPLERAFRVQTFGAHQSLVEDTGDKILVSDRRPVISGVYDDVERETLGRTYFPTARGFAGLDWAIYTRSIIDTSERSTTQPQLTFGHHVPRELVVSARQAAAFSGAMLEVYKSGRKVQTLSMSVSRLLTRIDLTGLEAAEPRNFVDATADYDLQFVIAKGGMRVALFALRQGLQESVNPTPRGIFLPY